MRTKNHSEDIASLAIILGFIVVIVGTSIWWLPQKWHGCTKLYDNRPAQVFCFLQK